MENDEGKMTKTTKDEGKTTSFVLAFVFVIAMEKDEDGKKDGKSDMI